VCTQPGEPGGAGQRGEPLGRPVDGSAGSRPASGDAPPVHPLARDDTGRVADGYRVQDQPWFVLVSGSGKIVWKHDGWLGLRALEAAAREA
jgi:hypothetical protein